MNVPASIQNDETKVKRYLVREFLWELAQHEPLPSRFAGLSQEAIEVVSFQGYEDMQVRVADKVYDVRLSWRKDTAPTIRDAD